MSNTIVLKDLLQDDVIARKDELTIIKQVANTKYEGELRGQGDTVTVEQFPLITGDIKVAGSTSNVRSIAGENITLQDWTVTSYDLTVDRLYQNGVIVKDIEKIQSNLDLQSQITNSFAQASAENEDTFVASLVTQNTAALKLADKSPLTLSASNTYSSITSLSESLSVQNAYGQRTLFISPAIKRWLKLENILDNTDTGLTSRLNGEIGKVDGFRVLETNNLPHVVKLTVDTIPTASDTMVVAGVTWTFVAAPSNPGEIDIAASAAAQQAIITDAINGTGTPGATSYIEVSDADRLKMQNAGVQIATSWDSDSVNVQSFDTLAVSETFTAATNIFGDDAVLMFATDMNSINFVSQEDQFKISNTEQAFRYNILEEKAYGGAVLGDNAKGIVTYEIKV